ncbi:archaeal proteasome endopeptidase complex subunit alpha [Natronosalvus rutilus]|uniref:Proteasome subunit alpha n=1 Tax=Natronosalvus rutilus TaxID=2953753 RepID=A0A9E7N6G4_9EURY|nr:archaeal proteasome endopeptidase complex subunit alpha [Natronosalvus rutilus]UTF52410.1 archaeal proteasome endopeptidase complex subunit alpha [Natronosalvus rutilus]
MQSNQQAYDRGTSIFSPDGRLYQVEYAREAVARGSPVVGVETTDGVVFVADSRTPSPLLANDSVEKLHDLDGRLAAASAGHVADARRLVDYARRYAQEERLRYGEAPGVEPVATAVADHVQETTQSGGTRPFGTALLLGGVDPEPRLYELDPSGLTRRWRATAIGGDSEAIRATLEASYETGLEATEGLTVALRALDDGREAEWDGASVDVAVVDSSGIDRFDSQRCAQALVDAELT